MQILQEKDTGNMGVKERETFLRNLIFFCIFIEFFSVREFCEEVALRKLQSSIPYVRSRTPMLISSCKSDSVKNSSEVEMTKNLMIAKEKFLSQGKKEKERWK